MSIKTRLERLEEAERPRGDTYVWLPPGTSAADAVPHIKQRRIEVGPNVRITTVSWLPTKD